MSQLARRIISKNVKFYREKAKLKREELSLMINRDNSYISKLEREKINITIDSLELISNVLKINIVDLFK